jgi:hypothetical protein
MAQFQLGNNEEASTALAGLERVVREELPPPETYNLGPDWIDWIIAHALLDEARSLIEGPTAANVDWRGNK